MNAPRLDLHCHSTASDGRLAPAALVERAWQRGVQLLALTDHDTTDGLPAAGVRAAELGLRLVPGVEISAGWEGRSIHVVGLAIDPACAVLQQGLAGVRAARQTRAEAMAAALEALGLRDALAGARRYADNPEVIGRSHFARHLVDCGWAPDVAEVFRHYLTPGRPGYVPAPWVGVDQAVGWIRAAGGVAVLAHPGHYRLGRARLEALCALFTEAGGGAIEVSSGACPPDVLREAARLARRFGLLASSGSDFHDPAACPADLGGAPALPADLPALGAQL